MSEQPAKLAQRGWIGVDLDGTLAKHTLIGSGELGEPIKPMVDRVKNWLKLGVTVKIVTARMDPKRDRNTVKRELQDILFWCQEHIGQRLEVTCSKDMDMVELWDDRAITVERNTGRILTTFENH